MHNLWWILFPKTFFIFFSFFSLICYLLRLVDFDLLIFCFSIYIKFKLKLFDFRNLRIVRLKLIFVLLLQHHLKVRYTTETCTRGHQHSTIDLGSNDKGWNDKRLKREKGSKCQKYLNKKLNCFRGRLCSDNFWAERCG